MSFEERVNAFLNVTGDIEQLETLLFERSAEVLQLRAFIKEKGLDAEYKARIAEAKADEQQVK
ncbi:hypothetical protein L604_000700000900 [Bacillus subtilis J27]|uniref:hypothetical protein n=1 Tax=Bacillus subtilis TaxID=1423 RepID=UPI0011A5FF61|nr:hypothetical protein [Bacillus subtilis]TWG74395.1 hypothetical protein L604_000700000900 [Bacillus subtilis J27]